MLEVRQRERSVTSEGTLTCQSYTRRNIVRGTFVDIEMRERNVGLYQKYRDATQTERVNPVTIKECMMMMMFITIFA